MQVHKRVGVEEAHPADRRPLSRILAARCDELRALDVNVLLAMVSTLIWAMYPVVIGRVAILSFPATPQCSVTCFFRHLQCHLLQCYPPNLRERLLIRSKASAPFVSPPPLIRMLSGRNICCGIRNPRLHTHFPMQGSASYGTSTVARCVDSPLPPLAFPPVSPSPVERRESVWAGVAVRFPSVLTLNFK